MDPEIVFCIWFCCFKVVLIFSFYLCSHHHCYMKVYVSLAWDVLVLGSLEKRVASHVMLLLIRVSSIIFCLWTA